MKVELRPLTVADSNELYSEVDANRLYLTNLAWTATATIDSVRDYIVATNASNDHLSGVFIDGHLVGCITLRDKGDHYDIGYWLGHAHRERGVMTEAVRRFVEHASRPITARTLHNNIASRKILLRNGFTETSRDDTWIHYQMGC